MITPIVIKIFFIIVISSFLIGLFVPMGILIKKGKDPHGTHENAALLARLTSFTIFSWLFYIIAYLIGGRDVSEFLILKIFSSDLLIIFGFIISSFGLLLDGLGTITLGSNFRIELPREEISLITSGIYNYLRNPIVMGVYLLLFGSFLIIPTILSLIFLIANIITFNSKVRNEERYLSKGFGDVYKDYQNRVGRYFPFVCKKNRELI